MNDTPSPPSDQARAAYFVVRRGEHDHPAFAGGPYDKWSAWTWLIEAALFAPRRINILGRSVELQRGQCSYSIRYLAEAWRWRDKGRVERFIARLKIETLIETSIETGQLVITICNYDEFQLTPGYSETPTETPPETPARQDQDRTKTNKNSGNSGNSIIHPESERGADAPSPPKPQGELLPVERSRRSRRVGARLPIDHQLPDDWRALAHELRPDLDPDEVHQRFVRYWTSPDCPRPLKKDWPRAWHNWIERERSHGQHFNGSKTGGKYGAAIAGARAALGKTTGHGIVEQGTDVLVQPGSGAGSGEEGPAGGA